jgi:MFS family permease
VALGARDASSSARVPGRTGHLRHHVRASFARPGFRRLLGVRLLGQFGDGVFQASLAGAVLFNPERQAHAADVAAGFAVLLVPYSLIGPFAGVLLDRWWRRTTLARGNALRAAGVLVLAAAMAAGLHGVPFYAGALVLISAARFLLAGLSAALPHLLPPDELVTGNAVSTTAGTVVGATGGGIAIGVHALLPSSNAAYAAIAAAAALPWLAAALVAARFPTPALGPTAAERANRESVRDVSRGLRQGLAHLRSRPQVAVALAAVATQRLCYGVASVCVVLLYRNHFVADGIFRTGLAGLSQAVAALAIGGATAALVTPAAFRRVGPVRWPAMLFLAGAAIELAFVLPYRLPLALAGVLLLGFVAQSVKICVDTLVQQQVDDEFRGRVFAVYDAVFNLMLVAAAVLTATTLPDDGHAPLSVLVLAGGYLLLAGGYAVAGDAARRATVG